MPHQTFISGFAGSGGVEFKKRLAVVNIACELDLDVIETYWSWEHGYTVKNLPFLKWYRAQKFLQSPVMIYCDAPYRFKARSSGRAYYKYEMSDEQHEDFLTTMVRSPHHVAISHYKDSMYTAHLKGWRFIEWDVMSHTGKRKEGLYMNYDEPKQLHQYDLLGDNFTRRQQLKRKKERFVKKLESLPPVERYALLAGLEVYLNSK